MVDTLPIIAHVDAPLTSADRQLAQQVADNLRQKYQQLRPDPIFTSQRISGPVQGRAFHCDDHTAIQHPGGTKGLEAYQERARLRALDGDLMATARDSGEAYRSYCQEQLGLGCVEWLVPEPRTDLLCLAEACWEDRSVRRKLVHAIRQEDLTHIHPHQGTNAIWRLALLLSQAAHRPVRVLGPPPGLNSFVNDKGHFTRLIQQLFGDSSTPPTSVVWSRAMAADQVRRFAEAGAAVALKLPNSAGGEGNLQLPMERINGRSIAEIDGLLHELLDRIGYESGDELLATVWQSSVLCAPSAQMWIPPDGNGDPILEGFFQQFIISRQGRFAGAVPFEMPAHLAELAARQCQLAATIFQHLGYVGRCSFDLVLIGDSMETASVEFIECNGRWGGTSLPMSLINRLFGDWTGQPFSSHSLTLSGAGQTAWSDWLKQLGEWAFDRRTGRGQLILLHPQILACHDQLSVIALADTSQSAMQAAHEEFPEWVRSVL